MQVVCSPLCARQLAEGKREKDEQKAKQALNREFRQRKEAIKSIPELMAEADRVFQAYVRWRDRLLPCVCCNKFSTGERYGGDWDGGHFRTKGAASHLRYHEDNCWRQLKQCNRQGAGRQLEYRKGLIARIGIERVEALENDNSTHKWTREELIAIRDKYRAKLKELKNGSNV